MDKRPLILIVEDNKLISEIIQFTLTIQPENYAIACAYDGVQGIKQAFEVQPDLIILDVHMPRADGYEVAQILRAAKSTVPIIMLTGDNNEAKGFNSGCNEYMLKPFQTSILGDRVRKHLKSRSQEKQYMMNAL